MGIVVMKALLKIGFLALIVTQVSLAQAAEYYEDDEASDKETQAMSVDCKNGGRCQGQNNRIPLTENRQMTMRIVDTLSSNAGTPPNLREVEAND